MTGVTLNMLKPVEIDRDAFSRRFGLYTISCKGYDVRADICDRLGGMEGVLSVRNDSDRRTVHVLTDGARCSKGDIVDCLRDDEAIGEDWNVSTPSTDEVDDHILIQLLLNSMNNSDVGGISNASGHLYVIVPSIKKTEVITLRISVSSMESPVDGRPVMVVSLDVASFTDVALRKHIDFSRRPFESYPRYAVQHGRLVRVGPDYDGTTYINRKTRTASRNTVALLNYSKDERLLGSKSSVFARLVSSFNSLFGEIATLEPAELEFDTRPITEDLDEEYEARVVDLIGGREVAVIDSSESSDGPAFSEAVVFALKAHGLSASRSTQFTLDGFGVRIVRDPEYYERNGIRDLHRSDLPCAMQHVVLGDDAKIDRTEIAVIAEQLVIKHDIRDGRISLYDWPSLGMKGDCVFAIPVLKPDDPEGEEVGIRRRRVAASVAVAVIHPDGTADFRMDDDGEHPFRPQLMTGDYEYAFTDPEGNSNLVRNSGVVAVPDAEGIRRRIESNAAEGIEERTKGVKDATGRALYLQECLNINTLRVSDTRMLYYVGVRGYNPNPPFNTAANVRLVEATEGSKAIDSEFYVKLMDVPFVRHKQSTIAPFPVKYLREWVLMQNREPY